MKKVRMPVSRSKNEPEESEPLTILFCFSSKKQFFASVNCRQISSFQLPNLNYYGGDHEPTTKETRFNFWKCWTNDRSTAAAIRYAYVKMRPSWRLICRNSKTAGVHQFSFFHLRSFASSLLRIRIHTVHFRTIVHRSILCVSVDARRVLWEFRFVRSFIPFASRFPVIFFLFFFFVLSLSSRCSLYFSNRQFTSVRMRAHIWDDGGRNQFMYTWVDATTITAASNFEIIF